METCVRGFSFMCDQAETMDLHFIEEDELERTWKNSRRERKKLREQKIWEEFVKEKDIISTVCHDDQYQFLEQLPENCLKGMMATELDKIKKEVKAEEEAKLSLKAIPQQPITRSPLTSSPSNQTNSDDENQHTCVVSFADVIDSADNDNLFHIFHDERDDLSDGENVVLNESTTSLPTVRERHAESPVENNDNRSNNTSSTSKSSENVTNVIESSIYCAKVKELRSKINAEILNMMTTLDRRDVFSMEQDDMTRMIKRAAEFSNRFNRIYIYQLQRQMHDIKRNDSINLPFAKHTQFQSQMVRIVSLHLNLLQSFQVFRKSAEQSWLVREGVSALGALLGATRAACARCAAVAAPAHLAAARDIYNDNLLESCDRLEEFVNEYTLRCEEFLNRYESVQMPKKFPRTQKPKAKKKPSLAGVRSNLKNEADTQLSMYSLDTLRLNTKVSGRNRDAMNYHTNKGGASKVEDLPKGQKKSPKWRRPLMRDVQARRAPRVRAPRDLDVPTMVESIDTQCISPCRPLTPEVVQNKSSTPRTSRVPHKELNMAKKVLTSPRTLDKMNHKTNISKVMKTAHNNTSMMSAKTVDSTQATPVRNVQIKKSNEKQEVHKKEQVEEREEVNKRREEVNKEVVQHYMKPTSPKLEQTMTAESLDKERHEVSRAPEECEVSRLLKQLCGGVTSVLTSGAKNAQLVQVNSTYTKTPPTTPQLLRILEETIQKKVPKSHYHKASHNVEKHRLTFNIAEQITDNMFQYRTKFVQHMLASPMYANSAVGRPWEMIGSVSEQIIDDMLMNCVKEMQLQDVLQELIRGETT